MLPPSLHEFGCHIFDECNNLRTVWVEGNSIDKLRLCLKDSVLILPVKDTFIGKQNLWDLRSLRDVLLPEGLDMVGNYWFEGSDIESVLVRASIRDIGMEAFCKCRRL